MGLPRDFPLHSNRPFTGSCCRRTQASTTSVSCTLSPQRWRKLTACICIADNHCGAIEPYQTHLRACLRLHKSDLCPLARRDRRRWGRPITAIRRLCLGMPKLPPHLVLRKLKRAALPRLCRREVQIKHVWFISKQHAACRNQVAGLQGQRATRSPGHHAAGTLPASGTSEGTPPKEEPHSACAYMSPPL